MAHLLGQRFWRVVYPGNPQPLVVLVDLDRTGLSKRHDKPVECDPSRGVHVHVVLVLDILVVDSVRTHALRVVPRSQESNKVVLELARELCNRRAGLGAHGHDLA